MNSVQYPGPEERDVVYNLSQQERDPNGFLEGLRYFQNVAELPRSTDEERIEEWGEIFQRACKVIEPRKLCGRLEPGLTPLHRKKILDLEYYPNMELPRGRTLWAHVFYDLINPETLAIIQSEILREYPLWRIVILTTDVDMDRLGDEMSHFDLVVYPDLVRFGNISQNRSLAEAYEAWKVNVAEAYLRFAGADIARLDWVKSRVPEAMLELISNDVVVVGAVDCGGQFSLWTLQYKLKGFRLGIYDRASLARGEVTLVEDQDSFPVQVDGTVGDRSLTQGASITLSESLVPQKVLGDLVVKRRFSDADPMDEGETWPLEIDAGKIIQQSEFT